MSAAHRPRLRRRAQRRGRGRLRRLLQSVGAVYSSSFPSHSESLLNETFAELRPPVHWTNVSHIPKYRSQSKCGRTLINPREMAAFCPPTVCARRTDLADRVSCCASAAIPFLDASLPCLKRMPCCKTGQFPLAGRSLRTISAVALGL
jgi:hypothetical protein